MQQQRVRRGWRLSGPLLVLLLMGGAGVLQAQTWTQTKADGFESGTFSAWDSTSAEDGAVSVTTTCGPIAPHTGTAFLQALLLGADDGGGTDFARVQWNFAGFTDGTLIASEFWLYTTPTFWADRTCTFQPFGWDTFPTLQKQMRIMVYTTDDLARLVKVEPAGTTEMTGAFDINDTDQWIKIRVEMKTANSGGWVKVYVNDVEVANVTGIDTYTDSPWTRARYGFADCSTQNTPLTVFVDDVKHFTGTE